MKQKMLISSPFTTPHGEVHFHLWDRDDLCDEEGTEDYLPEDFGPVLELSLVRSSRLQRGSGRILLQDFLSRADVKSIGVVFADISPLMRDLKESSMSGTEEEIMEKLERFYKSMGFENARSLSRIWLFLGPRRLNPLPT